MKSWIPAWRMAWREAKSSAGKFAFVVFGVAAGVGALTGVRGFSAAFEGAMKREARTLMAADLTVRLFSAPTPQQEAAIARWQQRGARMTPILETVSMMGAPGGTPSLVSIKAVDPGVYPFYGAVKLDPETPLKAALSAETIAVSDDLLVRLNARTGEMAKLGSAEFRIAGVVQVEPDRMTGSLNVGPRVLMTREGLERSGLMQIGSRASRRFLFKLPEQGIEVGAMRDDLKKSIPEAQVADYRDTHPTIARTLDRSTTFLSLVSLIALIVGALGVATAIHAHLQQRLDSIAILKCLGSTNAQIIRIYTLQTALLGIVGGAAGIAVGAVVQKLFPLLISRFFPLANLAWNPSFALEGLLTGLLVSLLFTLPPLLSIREVKPALIFRREMAETRPRWKERLRRQTASLASGAVILCGLGAVAGWLAESLRMGSYFVGGLAVALLALAGISWALLKALRLFLRLSPFRLPLAVRHGLANLYRPGNHAPSVLVALGVGVMFMLTIYLVQHSLVKEITGAAPPGAPNVFLINITPRESGGVRKLLEQTPGREGLLRMEPFASARLLRVGEQPLDRMRLTGHERYHQRNREVTYNESLPEALEVVQGSWWKPGESRALVAVDERTAKRLSIVPGSRMRWMVLGREFDAEAAALFRHRSVRMGPQPDYVFSKAAFAGLPVQYVAVGRFNQAGVAAIQREAWRQFPTVTVINAADVLKIVQEVIDQVALLVRFISGFALLAGAIILASTVAGTRMRRVRESAVLKTLGARRGHLIGIQSVEFAVLGAAAGLMGGVLATGFARVLLTRLLNAEFRLELLPNLATILLATLLAIATGWLASLRVLAERPLEVLRDE